MFDELTAQEARDNPELCEQAISKELESFIQHKCFSPISKSMSSNILTSRMLLKWKNMGGTRVVKARLCVHGFKDADAATLGAYASTSSRWGQRLVASIAASRKWFLQSADISTAFLQGVTFAELSAMTGEPLREVSLLPPKNLEARFRQLPGLQGIDFSTHCLKLHKPIYGLTDAPRAWRKKLHQLLLDAGLRSLAGDDSIYVLHCPRSRELQCVLSTHVDDLKVAGLTSVTTELFAQLEKHVGKLKIVSAYLSSFEHCGVVHHQLGDFSISLSQNHYTEKLRPLDLSNVDITRPETPVSPEMHALYLSLLGGISWLTLTRADISIYTQALQRASKAPQVQHLVRINKVVKWVRSRKFELFYSSALDPYQPVKVLGIGDSAFRKESTSGLAIRGCIVALAQQHPDHPGGVCHILEFFSRRQKRVTRSTYAAELLSLADCFDTCKLIAFVLLEVSKPTSLKELASLESSGSLPIPIEVCCDARGVYDSLLAEKAHCSESGLLMTLLSIREYLKSQMLSRLWWIDTRDMVSDGLTKGLVSRRAIMTLCNTGRWTLFHPCLHYQHPLAQK